MEVHISDHALLPRVIPCSLFTPLHHLRPAGGVQLLQARGGGPVHGLPPPPSRAAPAANARCEGCGDLQGVTYLRQERVRLRLIPFPFVFLRMNPTDMQQV